jgi:hypothetical protein
MAAGWLHACNSAKLRSNSPPQLNAWSVNGPISRLYFGGMYDYMHNILSNVASVPENWCDSVHCCSVVPPVVRGTLLTYM